MTFNVYAEIGKAAQARAKELLAGTEAASEVHFVVGANRVVSFNKGLRGVAMVHSREAAGKSFGYSHPDARAIFLASFLIDFVSGFGYAYDSRAEMKKVLEMVSRE